MYYTNSKSPELFKNRYLELLTRTHPALIFLIYVTISSISAYIALTKYNFGNFELILFFILGFLTWTLMEYLIHRYAYHDSHGNHSTKGIKYIIHGAHHMYPNDKRRILISPLPALLISAFFVLIFYLTLGVRSYMFNSGFFIGYTFFMSIHYMVHSLPSPKRFNFWWRYHLIHHYQQPDRAYGVLTSFWDWVFQTLPEKKRKSKLVSRIHKSTPNK
ncbi:sterol desaturase family protein [Aegicerativicinus sediminis]|uniref:sterol desaturase family protein n=1 Tax=Aegicerativicinus sediminis TaxID=2893202 RepID=UPI001E4CE874|nr:sterol desaturase family protein [Aegicerativicinus sediminis]